MILKGKWKGVYKYNNQKYQEISGFEQTNFQLSIESFQNSVFRGTIQDDLSTGGTEGIGTIQGKINENRVEFIKEMPTLTLFIDNQGGRKIYNKPHPKIYYQGILSANQKTITGTWKIKFSIIWKGIIPIILLPTSGTWSIQNDE
jgi:hypothetical protein